jgi:hypothetical protein
MSEAFASTIWQLYGADEFLPVLKACELGDALELLSLDPNLQTESIPTCPACEAWSMMFLPVHSFLESFPKRECPELMSHLISIWERCNEMSDEAFHCYDSQIFHHNEWFLIREEARVALKIMEWTTWKEHSASLASDCTKALISH